MDKEFFIRLLATSPRVTVPGFGTFLRKSDEDYTVFTPFLRTCDGVLVSAVMDEYSLDEDSAREMVVGFSANILEVLDSSDRYFLEGIGSLVRDSNGSITLLMDTSRQLSGQPVVGGTAAGSAGQSAENVSAAPAETLVTESVEQSAEEPAEKESEAPVATPAVTPVSPLSPARPVSPLAQGFAGGGAAQPRPFTAPSVQPSSTAADMRPPIPVGQPSVPVSQPTFGASPLAQSPLQQPLQQPVQQSMQQPAQQQSQPYTPQGQGVPAGLYRSGQYRAKYAPRKKGGDVWLIVAIIAAIIVIVYMIYRFFLSAPANTVGSESFYDEPAVVESTQ